MEAMPQRGKKKIPIPKQNPKSSFGMMQELEQNLHRQFNEGRGQQRQCRVKKELSSNMKLNEI